MSLQELQEQLVSQFNMDLTARDELVTLLSTQLSIAEAGVEKFRKEVTRRQAAMRMLRRKVSELEKICRGLEEEVERSREESFERSVMDEASEGALLVLQGSIGQLKAELEKAREDEVKMREERDVLKAEVDAQRGHAVKTEDKIKGLEDEREALTQRVEMLQAKVRDQVEAEVAFGSAKEGLTAEVEGLRRQVHDLQQASADKEVQLLQLTKARVRDKEDKEGLNIALDSKQQELELLKRKLGVKGTGGSTPAPNRVGLPDFPSRRESAVFVTPSAPRPRPRSVAGLMKTGSTVETPSQTGLNSGVRGIATGGSIVPPPTMKPSRVESMGPPPSKPASMNGASLSASTSSLSRSVSSSKPRTSLPADNHRRSSSAMSFGRTVASAVPQGGKENVAPVRARRMIVPA